MLHNYLEKQIRYHFPHTPTPDQDRAIALLAAFLTSTDPEGAFILRGYAGTGKTSLIGALVRTLEAQALAWFDPEPYRRALTAQARAASGR